MQVPWCGSSGSSYTNMTSGRILPHYCNNLTSSSSYSTRWNAIRLRKELYCVILPLKNSWIISRNNAIHIRLSALETRVGAGSLASVNWLEPTRKSCEEPHPYVCMTLLWSPWYQPLGNPNGLIFFCSMTGVVGVSDIAIGFIGCLESGCAPGNTIANPLPFLLPPGITPTPSSSPAILYRLTGLWRDKSWYRIGSILMGTPRGPSPQRCDIYIHSGGWNQGNVHAVRSARSFVSSHDQYGP